ncbi:MAG TPA: hypothetical protein VMH48_06090 [Methylomirabilota bacterium]|nr:hypothetical protein [Methylomirabilota bacterium]
MRVLAVPRAVLLILGFICHFTAQTAVADTLKEALIAKNLPIAGAKLANLEKNITSGAELDDPEQYVIAYYVDDGTGELNPPLFIDRYDRKSREWKSGQLPEARVKVKSATDEMDICLGSILNMAGFGGRLFLDTHINPSAGCLLVLSPDLKLEASLYGWMVGRLGNDVLIYERSQVHFAPVHPTEIAVYDLRSKRDATIFPPKEPTPVWQARVAQLREFYKPNEEWCNKNNDPCDPEWFDSDLQGPLVTSEAESAVAFLVSYEQIQYVEGDVQKPSGPKDILYVYRRVDDEAKMQVREMTLQEAKTRFGDVPLQSLLPPEVLQKIFAEEPAKKP